MAKVTPEFKRAFKHFIDGACYGRHEFVDDTDMILLRVCLGGLDTQDGTQRPRRPDQEMSVDDVNRGLARYVEWRTGLADGLFVAFDLLPDDRDTGRDFIMGIYLAAYEKMRDLLPYHFARTLLFPLDPLGTLTADAPDKWERMFGADYEQLAAQYRTSVKAAILAQLKETRNDDTTAVDSLTRLAREAYAYWHAMEAERRGGDAENAYYSTLEATPLQTPTARSVDDAMASFCEAYSHGTNPYTRTRPARAR